MKKKNYRAVVCEDGFEVSIQASETNYSSPRDNEGPYIEVELGFPNATDETILPYAEDRTEPQNTVYPYVPSEIVLEMLLRHGGMVEGEIPPMIVGYSNNFTDENR